MHNLLYGLSNCNQEPTLFGISNNQLLFGLIGSSNLRKSAFGLKYPFNFEADILIYDSSITWVNTIANSYIGKNGVLFVDNSRNESNEEDLFVGIDNSRIMKLGEYALEIIKELNDVYNKANPL